MESPRYIIREIAATKTKGARQERLFLHPGDVTVGVVRQEERLQRRRVHEALLNLASEPLRTDTCSESAWCACGGRALMPEDSASPQMEVTLHDHVRGWLRSAGWAHGRWRTGEDPLLRRRPVQLDLGCTMRVMYDMLLKNCSQPAHIVVVAVSASVVLALLPKVVQNNYLRVKRGYMWNPPRNVARSVAVTRLVLLGDTENHDIT